MANIFSSIQVRDVSFQNRIVMAPMVRFGFSCHEGIMGPELLQEYVKRADKGIGLIISQVLSVSPEEAIAGGAGAYSERHIGYLKRIADASHTNGTRFFAQLGLPGYAFYEASTKDVNALTIQELIKIRDEFIRAAAICHEAGLDGIELHGAHTFFLNMMASSLSNKRQDAYGGDLAGRLNLTKEIVEGIKSFAADRFVVSYRMGWGDSPGTDVKTAQVLERLGVDMLHVSHGIPEDRTLKLPCGYAYGDIVYAGCTVKQQARIPVIAVGDIKTLARGNALIESGGCDFVAYGRPFLADESFVEHSARDMSYKPCLECRNCLWFTNGRKCPGHKLIKRRLLAQAERTEKTL